MDDTTSSSASDYKSNTWASLGSPTASVTKFQQYLECLLDSESNLWCSPELRVLGQEASNQYCAWQSHSHDGHCLLNHGNLVNVVHDYYRNLEKNRCCLTLAGRRRVINSVRVVRSDDADDGNLLPTVATVSSPVRSRHSRRSADIVLSGDDLNLYQCALLSAFLPVLAAPGPPSPFTPALPTTPTNAAHGPGFSFGGAATAGDKETPSLRMSAAANALANLEKDVGSASDYSMLVATADHQYDRQAAKPGGPPPAALDSVTTEMLRELVRLVFKQTEQQQMCTEHDLRDCLGRRSSGEVLARHLMARLSVLENNSHQFYRPSAFLCPQAYDEWVQGEKQHIKQLLSRFWHYSLPNVSRSTSSTSLSTRLLRCDHHSAYVQLLERVVHQQESVKRRPGVPLLPTARRLLKEFALRFGVGELFCRIAYLRLLSQNMEHDVWFCRHVSVSLLAVLELLPVKPTQRTAAVKGELERLHETVGTLHSHVDHALTRVHILFPNNTPPDGILSMLQLLSLVLFTQRYLTNQSNQSVSHWVQRYLHDGFSWRYDYHKTVLSTELEVMSAVCPLTPALLNGLLVEIRNEVLGLSESFEDSFKRYFSISQMGRHAFYQLLMADVQELCQTKLPTEQLELDMLALMFRLAELDSSWSSNISVVEQVWRQPFFKLVLSWLRVLQKHALRWLLVACKHDSWSTLTIPASGPSESPQVHLQPHEAVTAMASTPLTQAFRPTDHSSLQSSGLGMSSLSAFTRRRSASAVALAGSFCGSGRSESATYPISYASRFSTFPSQASSVDDISVRHSAVLNQSVTSGDMASFDRALSLPLEGRLSETPVLSFMCTRDADSLSPVVMGEDFSSANQQNQVAHSPNDFASARSSSCQSTPGPHYIFRSENLVPAQPTVLQAPRIGIQLRGRKNAFFKSKPLGSDTPQSVTQVIPSPVMPFPNRQLFPSSNAEVSSMGVAFGSPVKKISSVTVPSAVHHPSPAFDKSRTETWVASMSQSDDTDATPSPASTTHRPSANPAVTYAVENGSQSSLSSATLPGSPDQDGHRVDNDGVNSLPAMERKISAQSNDSARTSRYSFSERSSFSPILHSIDSAGLTSSHLPVMSERSILVSSSLIDLIVVQTRLANTIASLTNVICPLSVPVSQSSTTTGTRLSPDAESLGSDVHWHKGMDIPLTVQSMQKAVFEESLDMMSECAMLYADNMLCADLCGIPEGVAVCLIGQDLLEHIKSRQREGTLWGCRHHHVAERCSSHPSSPSTSSDANDVRCSAHCVANGDIPAIEPIAAEMCTRVNNVVSLLSSYPLLHSYMLDRVCQPSSYPGRDSGLPFSPSSGVDPARDRLVENCSSKVCAHIGKVLDGMIYIMAHRVNLFAAPCLRELLSLDLPPSYSLAEHMQPLTKYLSRHLSKLKSCLYDASFRSLIVVLWKMIVQTLQQVHLESMQSSNRKGRLEDRARFLLRVVPHFMEFFHCCGDGMAMDLVSSISRRLVHNLNVVSMPTGSLILLFKRLQRRAEVSSVQGSVDIQPALVQALRHDLHALRKCFTGRELCDWLTSRCGQFGISSSLHSKHRIAQSLLNLGFIRFVDQSRLPESATPIFADSSSVLYRFVNSEECSTDSLAGQLLGSLEINRLEDSQLEQSHSLSSSGSGVVPPRNSALDCVITVLKSRSGYDRDARAHLARTGIV